MKYLTKNQFEALNLEVTFLNLKSSHQSGFIRKDVLRNFAKSSEKHLCQSLFFDKVAGLKRLCLFVKFGAGFENTIFKEHLWVTASVFYKQ